ncbi:MAG: methionine--tRNA ligase [Clostridiales bacterium]|nr:methionine--tRNA ligase [Clostridiales bacterium]
MGNKEKFYITTAIAYTSGKPHIGNTYEIILSDAIARAKRMQGYDVFFMTGTDEHGQKIEMKAQEQGVSPKVFVDDVAGKIKNLWDLMNISYDKFIRTTDADHEKTVQKIFKKFYDQGDIYKGHYEGMYCTPCESFWTESQLVEGKCPDCGRDVKPSQEEAYFFKMSHYAKKLVRHIVAHPEFIQPVARKNEMMNNFLLADEFVGKSDEELLTAIENDSIKTKLQDLCVSRSTFKWGIPVDFDEKHVVYVWLDALNNYITGVGFDTEEPSNRYKKLWPADVHVVGKDIVRFHTIYWPIFLMALGEPLPKQVLGHPWLLQGGDKMSKSKGNVLYADDLASVFGVDSVRYYVLREMPYAADGTITWELLCERNNTDLSNILGNLVKRTLGMSNQYFDGKIVNYNVSEPVDEDLKSLVVSIKDKVINKVNEYKVADALEELWTLFRRANKYIDETEPWNINKDENKKERLSTVLYNLLESINIGANLLTPFIPETANKIFKELNVSSRNIEDLDKFGLVEEYNVTKEPQILFNRIKLPDIQHIIDDIVAKQKADNAPKIEFKEMEPITIDDFAKVQMKVGTVLQCEAVPKSKLLHSTVRVGTKTLSILSGIAKAYTPEQMVGKKVVVITNLPPREMKGLLSEGMIICAEDESGNISLLSPERDIIPDGSDIS